MATPASPVKGDPDPPKKDVDPPKGTGSSDEGTKTAMTAAEYSGQVAVWLQQAYHHQMMAQSFSSMMAYQIAALQQQRRPTTTSQQPRAQTPLFGNNRQQQQQQQQPPSYREYRVPPLWKRFAAEFVDFLFLFVFKLAVTFAAVDTFEIIDFDAFISKYDSGILSVLSGEASVSESVDAMGAAFELTSEIVLLEMIHRVVVCLFETICTYRGPLGSPGGATPGKLMMGLRVVRCDQISWAGDPSRVRVSPASNLGVFWAALRAVLKNMSMAFLFPVSITFLFLPYNRTVYDVMSRSIVVEVDLPNRRRMMMQQQQRR